MSISSFDRWIELIAESRALVYAKRLAANDTLESGSNQAGPYLPKDFLFRTVPEIHRPQKANPDLWFPLSIDSHGDEREVRATWYNNKKSGHTRNEARLTNFGGARSPLLDPANTGALTLFAFARTDTGPTCRVWICTALEEEERAEAYIGPIEPGAGVIWEATTGAVTPQRPAKALGHCRLSPDLIPEAWLSRFPSGAEIIQKAMELLPETGLDPDKRLLRRRDCEYEVFLSIEEALVLPVVRDGFNTVDSFVGHAQTVLQRRKARSGRSLELQMKQILQEEGLVEGRDFQHGVESDKGRRPDFLFPSQNAYRDPNFPAAHLKMLATKTTCRDRWRQVRNEADRIATKHLLTLQEGITEEQHAEMTHSGIQLVVPGPLHSHYPKNLRPRLSTVRDFVATLSAHRR